MKAYLLKPSGSSVMILLNAGTLKKETKDRLKGAKQIRARYPGEGDACMAAGKGEA